MTDLFDDDDLFAIRPTPAAPPPPPPAPPAPAVEAVPVVSTAFVGPRWPCASLACPCGFRDEVKEPCPDALDCLECHGLETARRYAPRYLPPRQAGRDLTPHERRGLELDRR